MILKVCIKCNKEKEFSSIATRKKICYDCKKSYARVYGLKYTYNMSPEEYEELVAQQGHKCKSCLVQRKLYVDHDHKTGKVRGLLCTNCNVILGFAKDNVEVLQSLIDYLSKS